MPFGKVSKTAFSNPKSFQQLYPRTPIITNLSRIRIYVIHKGQVVFLILFVQRDQEKILAHLLLFISQPVLLNHNFSSLGPYVSVENVLKKLK